MKFNETFAEKYTFADLRQCIAPVYVKMQQLSLGMSEIWEQNTEMSCWKMQVYPHSNIQWPELVHIVGFAMGFLQTPFNRLPWTIGYQVGIATE